MKPSCKVNHSIQRVMRNFVPRQEEIPGSSPIKCFAPTWEVYIKLISAKELVAMVVVSARREAVSCRPPDAHIINVACSFVSLLTTLKITHVS